MAARPRKSSKRDLPPNLQVRKGFYSWRNPITKSEFGLGSNKQEAIAQAVEANIHILELSSRPRLIDRLIGNDNLTLAAWLNDYWKLLVARELSKSTMKARRLQLNSIRQTIGDIYINQVTTKDIAELLHSYEVRGKSASANLLRSVLNDIYKEAMSRGLANSNPVTDTKPPKVKVQRSRLVFDEFKLVYESALQDDQWLARCIELAMVTGQRREEIHNMKFKDIHDGKLWVIQSKTGMKLAIPLDIRLEAIGLSLADIVSRCRETRVISQYLVHYTRSGARVKVGQKIQPEQITRHFNLARDKTNLTWDKNPPTFHELRSLSSRLYTEERGKDFSQALLGHKSEKTASLYRDVRGAEWIEIKTA